jgi:hypothetical protein
MAMVFNYRFFDQTRRARRFIEERDLGLPTNVVALSHYATWSHCIDLILWLAGWFGESPPNRALEPMSIPPRG